MPQELGLDNLDHWIDIDPESRLAQIVGAQSVQVNSAHHQAVKSAGGGLHVTATCRGDGIAEALESADGRILTLQCHPEDLVSHGWTHTLFRAFAHAAAAGEPIGVGKSRPAPA